MVIVLISEWVDNSVKLTSEWSRDAMGQWMNGRVTDLKSATGTGGGCVCVWGGNRWRVDTRVVN